MKDDWKTVVLFLITARRANYAIISYILHMWIPRAVEPRLQLLLIVAGFDEHPHR